MSPYVTPYVNAGADADAEIDAVAADAVCPPTPISASVSRSRLLWHQLWLQLLHRVLPLWHQLLHPKDMQ